MKRILVGVDGSSISNAAAEFAAGIALATGAELELACAIEPAMLYGPDPTGEVVKQQYEGARAIANAALAHTAALPALQGMKTKTVAIEGAAADALAELAGREGVDLVVVGHRSRNRIARVMLGSVADRLAQICPRPLVVYR